MAVCAIGYYFYANLHIAELECFNILVSVRLMLDKLTGLSVRINCDNMLSVQALRTGKCRDRFIFCVIRDIWFVNDIDLVLFHKVGTGILSRGFKSNKDWLKLCEFRATKKLNLAESHLTFPTDDDLNAISLVDV